MLQTSLDRAQLPEARQLLAGHEVQNVPATVPVAVMPDRPACWKLLARPKSATRARRRLGQQHVVGLQVAVDETCLVGGGEALERLDGDAQRRRQRHRPPCSPASAPARCPGAVLEGEVEAPSC
jgi:hypothetical protein